MSRKITCLVCDDVRREADGRVSVMGIYENIVQAENIPGTLPRLSIFLRVSASIDEPVEKLEVRVCPPGEKPISFQTPDQQLMEARSRADAGNDEGQTGESYSVCMEIAFFPFTIKEEGLLTITIETERETIEDPPICFVARRP